MELCGYSHLRPLLRLVRSVQQDVIPRKLQSPTPILNGSIMTTTFQAHPYATTGMSGVDFELDRGARCT